MDQKTEGGREEPDEVLAIYGAPITEPVELPLPKSDFLPWHYPVKQVVREYQWLDLTLKLVRDRGTNQKSVLRYFTLPGADLLDVRLLADGLARHGVTIDYFGFDASRRTQVQPNAASWVATESALRQAGLISSEAIILPDDLEDIAIPGSQAETQLGVRLPFDVVNIDACSHLGYSPLGRHTSTFDALQALLRHQVAATKPWLLFVTTRVDPNLLGRAGPVFQKAVNANVEMPGGNVFLAALAKTVEADANTIGDELAEIWTKNDSRFLRLYAIGLGKYLLQFFNGQPNSPATVQLVSAYTYRIHDETPDMLALAFRISPLPRVVFEPSVGGTAKVRTLEPQQASYIAARADRLWDIDLAIAGDNDLKNLAIDGTRKLLQSADYNLPAWEKWRLQGRAIAHGVQAPPV